MVSGDACSMQGLQCSWIDCRRPPVKKQDANTSYKISSLSKGKCDTTLTEKKNHIGGLRDQDPPLHPSKVSFYLLVSILVIKATSLYQRGNLGFF